jgi:hypothetical protein
MKRPGLVSLLIVLLCVLACAPKKGGAGKESDTGQNPQTSISLPDQVGLNEPGRSAQASENFPFSLTIGTTVVGTDRRVSVPENQGVPIQIHSGGSAMVSGQMKAIDASGKVSLLGAWQAAQTQFFYVFPYGENHLVITFNNKDYDFLVVAGIPLPAEQSQSLGCSGGYMDLNQGAVWNYEETSNKGYLENWVYKMESWNQAGTGDVNLAIIAQGSTGVEHTIDRTAKLDLLCSKGTVFVSRIIESSINPKTEIVTTYDKNTIYMPPVLAQGVEWQRIGIREVKVGEEEGTTYHVTEIFSCTGKEHVVTKSGEFDADKVEYSISTTLNKKEITHKGVTWYVPGLGRVLSVGDLEESPRLELVSFTGVSQKNQGAT